MGQNTFADRVREAVRQIREGQTRTYGDVAKAVGHSGAARAVGTVMRNNHDPTVPCHRVIRSDGTVGAYNRGGPSKKQSLLRAEGVKRV
jgi:O-6-methylguanine DNA methyltransferase